MPVITAVIKIEGDDNAKAWAEGLAKNAKTYQSNSPILKAVEAVQAAARTA